MSKGIEKIKIPIKASELTIDAVEPYLKAVFRIFRDNCQKIRKDYDTYCLDHAILSKTRVCDDDSDVNHKVLIPNLMSAIDWKNGYVHGNPIKYAQSKTTNTDDIEYLNKYTRSCRKQSVDKSVGAWVYATGIGYYFIEPKRTDFDTEQEAPFVLYCLEADTCAKVYSSYVGNEPLFDLIYTTYEKIDKDQLTTKYDVLQIYLGDTLYTYEKKIGDIDFVRRSVESRGLAGKPLPLVEKRLNDNGIGIVAMGRSLQEAIDNMISNGLDNVEDIVNEIFVYQNVSLGKDHAEQAANHRAMKKNRALVLNTPSGSQHPAKLDTITPKLSLADLCELYAIANERFHSTIGVPVAVSSTNSGGTTKSGSEVANGYDNAYNRALDDKNSFMLADMELLEKILWICKNTPNNHVDNLSASDIEIKYAINLTDNILSKTQAYVNLVSNGVPPTMALRMCKLSNDPEAEGRLIDEYAKTHQVQQSNPSQEEL